MRVLRRDSAERAEPLETDGGHVPAIRTVLAVGALGGLVGGVAATMFYDVAGALAFPLDKTSQPVSATVVTRLLAQLVVAMFVAAGAALGANDSARRGPTAS